ncbi:MAG: hypothetical protein AUG44_22165 [Actinobacteria bacterium 13_1_20CM_3_71_11]|nr:MAG: hypothetical protein AUG44_22165 [Actinobacteria bacterium 13_1_20CM_3_71_11]TML22935.1 MAG: hypothetical protein E6G35_14655 [Actinomycetota bacterium]
MADLTVSPESLRAAGRQFGQLADRLNTEWTSFASQVQAMGDIFGDDMVGGLIGASHEGAMEVAGQSYQSVIRAYGSYADGLSAMADRYDETEQGHVDTFSKIYP